jgi:crotonobetainyl-CoA:carnitine CoA-transferase CaiB-like acyl-CoA transferase
LGRVLPLPFASLILADLGACVIKVEDVADRGGVGRDMLTPPEPSPAAEQKACAFNHLARNKKSIALNLSREEAKEIFRGLARNADVIMESFRPGVVKRLGVDYEVMRQVNPRLVYLSLSAYGQQSPCRELPGHEPEYCGLSGASALTGDDQGEPVLIGANLADVSGSLHAVIAVLAALRLRDQTGQGCYLDLSIADCMLSFTGVNLALYFRDGFVPKRGWQPPYRHIWRAKDGKYLVVTNPERHLWQNLCKALNREDLIPKQRPKGEERRKVNQEVAAIFLTKDRDQWVAILRQAGVSAAPVNEIDEVAADPHYNAREMFWELKHPQMGKVKQLGTPFKFADAVGMFRDFAPGLGQHTGELLASLGYGPEHLERLRKDGIIK